jgi:excisionase family DNA binding protein
MGNLLTVAQVAKAIGRSEKTVYRYIKQGRMEADRTYGVLVPRAEVVRWLRDEQKRARDEWQERIDKVRAA